MVFQSFGVSSYGRNDIGMLVSSFEHMRYYAYLLAYRKASVI